MKMMVYKCPRCGHTLRRVAKCVAKVVLGLVCAAGFAFMFSEDADGGPTWANFAGIAAFFSTAYVLGRMGDGK